MILHFYWGVGTPKSSKGLEAQGLKAKGDDVIEAGFVVSRKTTTRRRKATTECLNLGRTCFQLQKWRMVQSGASGWENGFEKCVQVQVQIDLYFR